MLAILNGGVAGASIPDLENIANGLLMAKKTPGALQVGNMLLEMIALNQEYSRSVALDPLVVTELEV